MNGNNISNNNEIEVESAAAAAVENTNSTNKKIEGGGVMSTHSTTATSIMSSSDNNTTTQEEIVDNTVIDIVQNNNNNNNNTTITTPLLEMEGNNNSSSELLTPQQQTQSRYSPFLLANNSTIRNNNNNINKSLARSIKTPWFFTILIPLLIISCHFIFLYGQVEPMWKLRLERHVDIWANATSSKAQWAFDTLNIPKQISYSINEDKDVETFTYWYAIKQLWYAKGIPGSKFMPRLAAVGLTFFSGIWPHLKLLLLNINFLLPTTNKTRRTSNLRYLSALGKWSLADVLAVCVMVGVLNLNWIINPIDIKHGLIEQLPLLLSISKSIKNPTDICTSLLKYGCSNPSKLVHKTKCIACKSLINNAYDHPDWVQSTGKLILDGVSVTTHEDIDDGENYMKLSVIGMRGIYAFCGAVILSILLSVLVDIFDHRDRQYTFKQQKLLLLQHQNRQQQRDGHTTDDNNDLLLQEEGEGEPVAGGEQQSNTSLSSSLLTDGSEPLLLNNRQNTTPEPMEVDMWSIGTGVYGQSNNNDSRRRGGNNHSNGSGGGGAVINIHCSKELSFALLMIVPFITSLLVLLAITMPSMERKVSGAIPKLLKDVLGFDANRFYSLRTLMETTGEAGGWDYLLMGTFGLFIVVGPALRSLLCIFGLGRPTSTTSLNKTILMSIDFIGSFCAWEVLIVAVFMVDMLMPSITSTIIKRPECLQINSQDGNDDSTGEENDSSCLEVEYNILKSFGFVIVGGLMLLLTSSLAVQRLNYTYTHYTHDHEEEVSFSQQYDSDDHYDMNDNNNNYVPLNDDDDNEDINNNTNNNARYKYDMQQAEIMRRGLRSSNRNNDNNRFDNVEQV